MFEDKHYFAPIIGGIDLYQMWHLIPAERPHVNPPEVRTRTVEVPGRNGTYDFTEAFGGPTYENSKGEWKFYIMQDVDPGTGIRYDLGGIHWNTVLRELITFIHGKRLQCLLVDDINTYMGRFVVSSYEPGKNYSTVTISYEIDASTVVPTPTSTEETGG